jgi:hypothetical protein
MFLKKTSTTEQEIDAMNANFVRIIKYELKWYKTFTYQLPGPSLAYFKS